MSEPFVMPPDATAETAGAAPEAAEPAATSPHLATGTAKGASVIGKVASPLQREATSDLFHFWVPPDALVEKTQIVRTESQIAARTIQFYGIVDEVYRQSRKRSMGEEYDTFDGDVSYQPPFAAEGVTYAAVSILRTQPPVLTPPMEQSAVYLGGAAEARLAYGADLVERPLAVGLIKNGGSEVAGPGEIDLDYLLGTNGGHMNVNGAAGRGTKSSFLLHVNYLLLYQARRQKQAGSSNPGRLRIVPIILNVKGFDLFHLDRGSSRYHPDQHRHDWETLGIQKPEPFQNVAFYAAQRPGSDLAVLTGRPEGVKPYSWSLADVVEKALLQYLFAEVDPDDSSANFSVLVLDIENWLADEKTHADGTVTRSLRQERPQTFDALLEWVKSQAGSKEDARELKGHHNQTWLKLHRRLLKLIYESGGVLRRADQNGKPLVLEKADTSDPVVVDLAALAGKPELQRFVVATILRELVQARTGAKAIKGLVYLVTLDELNRFAPRGAKDSITRLIETVAAEMRSQGIILLGAQQQASKVSEKVIENAALRVLGCSGSLELAHPIWSFLSASAKRKAASLDLSEKLVIQDNFREPMHLRIPFPAWAMNPQEAILPPVKTTPADPDGEIASY